MLACGSRMVDDCDGARRAITLLHDVVCLFAPRIPKPISDAGFGRPVFRVVFHFWHVDLSCLAPCPQFFVLVFSCAA
jgi:hypothetical protein